ncbi:MAG: NADH:ubiquinone oxidoreductase [Icmadophila ericetorum]|nr:NADH:ubiquinone oxidoreductase [Icmadophila ericetorum]
MPASELMSSSPASSPLSASASKDDALAYYKSQYEQLEAELADFQASSRELEAELEKDVEAAEKRERQLQEKVEGLGFEVDEWKAKCKQSKAEANIAQNALQKEITTLRDTNRTMQFKLRDIEVVNDDFERQARNTTSSLEDLESKYKVAIERAVMLEEEIKAGEQEREALRIETQRLRDELSDLKVEAEIMQDKLRRAETALERRHVRQLTPPEPKTPRPQSLLSEFSPGTTASSPVNATPPTKSASSAASDTPTPPSPPVSEKSLITTATTPASSLPKPRLSLTNSNVTPRPGYYARHSRQSRGPSISMANSLTAPTNRRATLTRSEIPGSNAHQASSSLMQIRGLIGKMQKLEQRVQSARSKLPTPSNNSPRSSPRPGSSLSQSYIPPTVTVRSARKRTGGSNTSGGSSSVPVPEDPSGMTPSKAPRTSRLSYSRAMSTAKEKPDTASARTSSRASNSSHTSFNNALSSQMSNGTAGSRISISGARTPLGLYSSNKKTVPEPRPRPRSSLAGSYASSHGHGHSQSMSFSRSSTYDMDESLESSDILTPTPSRRTTLSKDGSGIPAPSTLGRRRSGTGFVGLAGRRISSGPGTGDMGPPLDRKVGEKKLAGLGETY